MSMSEEERGAGEPPVLAGVEDLGSEGRFRRARATGGTGVAPLEIWLGEPVVLRIDFVPARDHPAAPVRITAETSTGPTPLVDALTGPLTAGEPTTLVESLRFGARHIESLLSVHVTVAETELALRFPARVLRI
ncbi:hypothetical protein ACF1BP_34675 [Streptomyces sp. NPDC014735]|nr:hypothetical protein [Streptomyces sp. CB01580]OKJ20488.1 hypothetical protein AMK22_34875 [Streptomyces sp. CB01580]